MCDRSNTKYTDKNIMDIQLQTEREKKQLFDV